jgi:uncharacterized RDD family membrane protein YckC
MAENSAKEAEPGLAAPLAQQEIPATVAYLEAIAEGHSTPADGAGGDDVLAPGTLLKHFRIVGLLGRGGMGDVYEAHDESLERTVALKVIRAAREIDVEDTARLVHEARAQARINHPHVVQIYFVGLEPESPFLAMEIVRGITLAERISRGPIEFGEIVRTSLQMTAALQRAAQMGIVHADIKPSNILLDEAGSAKLSDFGLAQRNLTREKSFAGLSGTPKYMAPELLNGARSSVASDMYALGITLYELTLAKYPYGPEATTVQQQFDLHRSAEIAFPDPWPSEIPEGWKGVLTRLLEKQPEKRYPDYAHLHADIRRFQPMARLPVAMMPRAIAWLIDFLIITILMAVVGLAQPLTELAFPNWSNTAGLLTALAVNVVQILIFALLVVAHGHFRTTPGKRLFQISLTDQHGLPLPPLRLMPRLVLSQFPASVVLILDPVGEVTGASESGWLTLVEAAICGVWLIGTLTSMLIDKRRLALHDRLLGTRAVVDHAR